jgi:hypothetical protein
VHEAKPRKLFDSGVSIFNVHAGQMDHQRVIEFYGREVLGRYENGAAKHANDAKRGRAAAPQVRNRSACFAVLSRANTRGW